MRTADVRQTTSTFTSLKRRRFMRDCRSKTLERTLVAAVHNLQLEKFVSESQKMLRIATVLPLSQYLHFAGRVDGILPSSCA